MTAEARLGESNEQREWVEGSGGREQLRVPLEATGNAGKRPIEDEVPSHDLRMVTVCAKDFRDRGALTAVGHRLEVRAMLRGQQAGEHAAVRGKGPALGGIGTTEVHGLVPQSIEKRRPRPRWIRP